MATQRELRLKHRRELKEQQISLFLNDLYLFYRYFVASDYDDDVPAPHIRELAKHLTNLKLGVGKHRLAVSMPPRHSKSSMVTIAFPLWLIFQNPKQKILIVASPGLAEVFGIRIREYVKQYGSYFNCYLSDIKSASTYLMFCDHDGELYSGNIRLTSPEGSITGQDVDILIVDDPYKGLPDELTPSGLQKKIDWANTILEQRIEPHTKYCILHTRWNSNDLIGYYKEKQSDDFTFVTYPALKNDGTPLWGERYTKAEILKKRKNIGERLFSSIYQQQPLDETSTFFNISKIHWTSPEDLQIEKSVRAWDMASSDELQNNSDYTAGTLNHRVGEKIFYCNNLIHGRYGNDNYRKVKQVAVMDTPSVSVEIETGIAAAGKLLFHEWEQQLKGFNVERAEAIGSKVDRATPFKNAVEDGLVYIDLPEGSGRQALLDELKSFPNGKHDDIVDSLSHGFNYLFLNPNDGKVDSGPDLLYLDI